MDKLKYVRLHSMSIEFEISPDSLLAQFKGKHKLCNIISIFQKCNDNKPRLIKNKEKEAYYRQYYENNKEKLQAYRRDYYRHNKEKIVPYQREYYKNNKEKLQAYQRDYYRHNKEKLLLYQREYYKNNKDKIKVTRYKYLENKEKIGNSILN